MKAPHLRFVLAAAGSALAASVALATPPARTVQFVDVPQPIAMAATPADPDYLYICQRPGVVSAVNISTKIVEPLPVLDITPGVSLTNDDGLLGIAFDPNYATNRYFYINYNDLNSHIVLERHRMQPGSRTVEPGSATIIWRYPRPLGHNGGWIGFCPVNNLLYITSGDGDPGGLPDPVGRAQDTVDQPMGKILRINPSSDDFPSDPMRNYAIPPANPFVGVVGDDEIWAYGVRNPWRAAFDPLNGDFIFGDVGADFWEEVNFEPASSPGGRNYGWACMEGNHCTISTACTCGDPSLTPPIYEYPHPTGTAVTGGCIYRGPSIPALQGVYIFADLFRAKIWSMRVGPSGAVSEFTDRSAEFVPAATSSPINFIATFGQDAAGEVYIANLFQGRIYKIVPYPCAPVIDLSPPSSMDVRDGTTATLRAYGAGADPLTIQWRRNGVNLVDGGRISGANTLTLTITSAAVADSGTYDVVLSNPCGPDAACDPVALTVFTCSTADINGSGSLTVQDIFDFLGAYFGGLPAGDFNRNDQVTVQDIFDFLAAYFAGCI
ncbi:MAG: PQQ-dependent sugar dehydrogenase [Phycisphaerales bacterium]|nr:PQQ-dependent sugar dehydrogenase [Phycisphaerales bacterium]